MNINAIDLMKEYKGRSVLVTGHTGFKGSWMTRLLLMAGARVTGYALNPPTDPSLFELLGLDKYRSLEMEDRDYEGFRNKLKNSDSQTIDGALTDIVDFGLGNDKKDCDYIANNSSNINAEESKGSLINIYGDICDLDRLKFAFDIAQPEIVIHMAAQPLVRLSYIDPVGTYATNVMGSVNMLECCRLTDSVKSLVNVTTDKVYRNLERDEGYKEGEELCGYDPYSNSKSCSELVTDSYRNSFLREKGIAVTTMRAGNVIGGGDFAKDRIIPDCVRAAIEKKDIIVRNPYSTRPYQHVLEPVVCYLRTAIAQLTNPEIASAYNIGPNDSDALTTGNITTLFCDNWNDITGDNLKWIDRFDGGPHEANYLKLNCSKIKAELGWQPSWDVNTAIRKLCEWYKVYADGENLDKITCEQIIDYIG